MSVHDSRLLRCYLELFGGYLLLKIFIAYTVIDLCMSIGVFSFSLYLKERCFEEKIRSLGVKHDIFSFILIESIDWIYILLKFI